MKEEAPTFHNYVYSSEMVTLVTLSNAYCRFLEELKGTEGKAFIRQSVNHISAIYAAVIKLGETEPVSAFPPEPVVTEQEWASIYQQVSLILGPHNDFLRMVEDKEFDRSDLVTHTISEDMADLYQELRDFNTNYSRGMEEMMNDAAWELRERFAESWGKKALRSLMALHDLYARGINPTE